MDLSSIDVSSRSQNFYSFGITPVCNEPSAIISAIVMFHAKRRYHTEANPVTMESWNKGSG